MTGSVFITGDIFLTLIQREKTVSMAVFKSTAILHDGSRVSQIAAGTIGNAAANIKLTGQILHLVSAKTTADDVETEDGDGAASWIEDSLTWLWTGIMAEVINPAIVDGHGRLSEEAAKTLNPSGTTWAFRQPSLNGSNIRTLPKVKPSPTFPYKTMSGQVVSDAGTALVADKSANGCLYCPNIPKNWPAHIGDHILCAPSLVKVE
ncbi:hypothetical protein B0H13DRAFT_1879529 [Mycena leptocephala]|nr:hypothetical protein B0H13DRAFT_1879529 [Mycena leptocephala]